MLRVQPGLCCAVKVDLGLGVGSGSANRTVGGDDLLSALKTVVGVDFRLDFIDDRLGLLDAETEETLEALLKEDRSEIGVVVPLLVEQLSACWTSEYILSESSCRRLASLSESGATCVDISSAALR